MKKTKIIAASLALFLSGCSNMMETMFSHFTLDDGLAANIARGNAAVNLCMSKGLMDKNLGYAFNSISAQILDITVIDRRLYAERYEHEFNASAQRPSLETYCAEGERMLPQVTQDLAVRYGRISHQLRVARAEEQQQIAAMMRNFGSGWNQTSYATAYSWPRIKYAEQPSAPAAYLVNTSNGMVQCRTTNKNYVFCM